MNNLEHLRLMSPFVWLLAPRLWKYVDCDELAVLTALILTSRGIPSELVAVAQDDKAPDKFNHVYVQAVLNGGLRIPLDPYGEHPGWEPPYIRRLVTPMSGAELSAREPRETWPADVIESFLYVAETFNLVKRIKRMVNSPTMRKRGKYVLPRTG